jgi:L-asparaginase
MPALIIHGGAGRPRAKEMRDRIASALDRIACALWNQIEAGGSALNVAVEAAVLLEDDPLFNAGLGSKLQRDGAARLSAALMNGQNARFSGVVNVEGLLNPIRLCAHLQNERDRVLSGQGALERARILGLAEGDVRTQAAIDAWQRAVDGETGTIGAIVLDTHGHIAAATSTGGRGMEGRGRVSDSCTVAGNYATQHAGVSCTGIGEDIVDGALAVRLVTAVESGESIRNAALSIEQKMKKQDWNAGLIGLDATGQWAAIHTTEIMYWHATDEHGHHRFKDPDER